MNSLYEDFHRFALLQLKSGDVDPAGPVLRYLFQKNGLTRERRMWFTLVYVAYYDIASAVYFYREEGWTSGDTLPKGPDRRCLRPKGFMDRHLASYGRFITKYGGIENWLTTDFTGNEIEDWHILRKAFEEVAYNGRWASYKLAKMFRKLHDLPVVVPDLGHKNSSGPRQGLGLLFSDLPEGNDPWDLATLDEVSTRLHERLKSDGLDIDLGTLETILCNFAGLYKGRFYVGRNIDRMQSQVLDSPVRSSVEKDIFEAREKVLARGYLGELNGWDGIRSSLEKVYKEYKLVTDTEKNESTIY